jgi:enoyl-CoA hydratase/carnithine racemase
MMPKARMLVVGHFLVEAISSSFSVASARLNVVKSVRAYAIDIQVIAALTITSAVITVLHGYSVGLAIDISCCADVRICSQDTKFSV